MAAIRSGIPTTYSSTHFRSRLEARWAAFFDLIRWHWVYEPFDTPGWIPDFLIEGDAPFLVEVGPCVSGEDYAAKSRKPCGYLELPTLIVGVSSVAPVGSNPRLWPSPGLIVNEFQDGRGWPAYWMECGSTFSVYGDDIDRPCRHGDTGHASASSTDIEQLWRRAGNEVQWQAHGPQTVDAVLRGLAR